LICTIHTLRLKVTNFMKTNYRLFVGLAVFYAIMTFVYYYVGGEPLGISCLLLSSLLAAMVG